MPAHHRAVLAALLLSAVGCLAQEQGAIDRTDPQAVTAAYMAAVDAGDAKAAANFIAGDANFKETWLEAMQMMAGDMGQEDFTLDAMLTEISFLPLKAPAGKREMQAEVGEKEATVSLTERAEKVRKFVLTRDEQGRWCVDLQRSITATTGLPKSFFVDEMMGIGVPAEVEGPAGFQGDPELMATYRENLLGRVVGLLRDWAEDHDGLLPPAETWLDDAERCQLWPDPMEEMMGEGQQVGYALNMALPGKALPRDEDQQRNLVVLFECADFDRNMVGDPDAELLPVGAGQPAPLIAVATGEVLRVPPGLTPSEAVAEQRLADKCGTNVTALCSALLAYARNHEGRLPAGATWCDDIEPYLRRMEADAEVFHCPGAPQLEYGYALNEALAGADVRTIQEPYSAILILPSEAGVRNEVLAVPAKVGAGRHCDRVGRTDARTVTIGYLSGVTLVRPEGRPYEEEGDE